MLVAKADCVSFVLFLVYFPESKKRTIPSPDLPTKVHELSDEWRGSLIIAALCIGHLAISFFVTVILLAVVGSPAEHWQTNYWAGFLGLLSMFLASFQYLPQIIKTWKRKVDNLFFTTILNFWCVLANDLQAVGALSIPMMLLQTPGYLE